MILICDSGSTKADWALLDAECKKPNYFTTSGLNPHILSALQIEKIIREQVLTQVDNCTLDRIYFYGAGVTADKEKEIKEIIGSIFNCPQIEVYSDLLGAIRATVADKSGVVAILGTGSGSCRVKEGKIVEKIASGGYLLGDEGSGYSIGRALLADIIKGIAPQQIIDSFCKQYKMEVGDIVPKIYSATLPNRTIASFAQFVGQHINNYYCHSLVKVELQNFVSRHLSAYSSNQNYYFVGSIATNFESILEEVMAENGRKVTAIVSKPIENLVAYHTSKKANDTTLYCHIEKNEKPFIKITEQSSLYDNLEKESVANLVKYINIEDHKVADAVKATLPQIEKLVSQLIPRIKKGGRLFYMGAGTSGRLGVLDASEVPPTFGMPPTVVIGLIAGGDKALRIPVEGAEDNTSQGWQDLQQYKPTENDTIVGIASSGSTPYVVGVVKAAKEHGLLTACIVSNPNSPLAQIADIAIETIVGPEFITGSSRMKSGTAQKMVCNIITTTTMVGIGRVVGNRMVNMQLSNKKLIDRGTRMIVQSTGLDYWSAQSLLLVHGSVAAAIDAFVKK